MTFSQNYFPTHTGTPPVRIECIVIPTLLGANETKPGYSLEFKIWINGDFVSQAKGTVETESKDEATKIAYGQVIDALATHLANVLGAAKEAGIKIGPVRS